MEFTARIVKIIGLEKKIQGHARNAREELEQARRKASKSAEDNARRLGVDPSNFGPFSEPESLPSGHPDRKALKRAELKARLWKILGGDGS